MLPDFRTPMLWAVCFGFAAALLTAGVERTRATGARADLAAEQRDRAKENVARAMAALADLQRTVALVAIHAKNQQESVDAYEEKLAAIEGRRRARCPVRPCSNALEGFNARKCWITPNVALL